MIVPSRGSLPALFVALALVFGACTSGSNAVSTTTSTVAGTTTTNTTTAPTTTATVPPTTPTTVPATTTVATTTTTTTTTTVGPVLPPGSDKALPVDPAVTIGSFDNGLTYYIRENGSPGLRAQLRLVVNAGSVLEDADQSGAAHFLEHMLFNGTERFPKNELIDVLEAFGSRFGPDVNAYTSFDGDGLRVGHPDRRPAETIESAFDVLLEWAARATIAADDVVEERGVIVEEWRLRDLGVDGRISTVVQELLLVGTAYEGMAPIGEVDHLRVTEFESLRRFYDDWYRPDLMAVIAVGDFDAAVVEMLIRERFEPLFAPPNSRPRPVVTVNRSADPLAAGLADPDLPSSFVAVLFPAPALEKGTEGGLRDGIAVDMAFEMIADRLTDQVSRGEASFFTASSISVGIARALQAPGIEVESDVENLSAGIGVGARRGRACPPSRLRSGRVREGDRRSTPGVGAGLGRSGDHPGCWLRRRLCGALPQR